MERCGFLKQSLSAVAFGLAGGCTQGERSTGSPGAADPARLHEDAIVIDTYGKLYLEDFQKGQVDAIVHGSRCRRNLLERCPGGNHRSSRGGQEYLRQPV